MIKAKYYLAHLFNKIWLVLLMSMLSFTASAAGKSGPSLQTAVFAGGCFWGVDAVFKHVKGVAGVESGYSGGSAATAHYELVSNGNTGHAESVRVRFDPAKVSYQTLLEVFFSVVHNPTQLNRQGPDFGTQYRSAIFYTDQEQQQVAKKFISQLTDLKTFSKPIVTQVVPLQQFYPAEEYHQNFLALNPNKPYIVVQKDRRVKS